MYWSSIFHLEFFIWGCTDASSAGVTCNKASPAIMVLKYAKSRLWALARQWFAVMLYQKDARWKDSWDSEARLYSCECTLKWFATVEAMFLLKSLQFFQGSALLLPPKIIIFWVQLTSSACCISHHSPFAVSDLCMNETAKLCLVCCQVKWMCVCVNMKCINCLNV